MTLPPEIYRLDVAFARPVTHHLVTRIQAGHDPITVVHDEAHAAYLRDELTILELEEYMRAEATLRDEAWQRSLDTGDEPAALRDHIPGDIST